MTEIKTSYDALENDGVESLSASGEASSVLAPCQLEDIIAIYPVRLAWGDLKGDVNADFTYPTSLSAFSAPSSPQSTAGFALRRLRTGHVMIYDVGASVWSAFSFAPDDTPAEGGFTHQVLKPGETEWTQHAAKTPFAHVPDSATEVYICFVEHLWSRATMQRAHANTDGFRDKVMTRVNLTAPSDATFSAPLDQLAAKVEEFSPNGLVQPHEDWLSLSESAGQKLQPDTILKAPMATGKTVAPIMIALHDPAGVVLEMAMCHANRTAVRAEYLQANAYALATARATQVMQNHARLQLRTADLGYFEKRALRKWGAATRPERDVFLTKSEETLKNFEVTTTGPLAAWQKYFEMGLEKPTDTPGSIQTHLLHYDPKSDHAREVAALGRFAHDCVAALVSSKAGQDRVAAVLMAPDRWKEQLNPTKAFMSLAGAGLNTLTEITQHMAEIRSAADDLLRDISLPMALQISKLQRIDMLTEINRFTSGIYNRTLTPVMVDIDDATREVNRRPRASANTLRPHRGLVVHRHQTPTMMYKYDGTVHVAGPDGVATVGAVGAGFGIFANALNMMELIGATEKSTLKGAYGAIGGNPYLGMTLTTIDTMNQLFDLSAKVQEAAGAADPQRYRITGKLSRSQLTALMRGKPITQDLVKTLIENGKGANLSRAPVVAPQRTLMATLGTKILSGAGIALGVLDLFNAAEAFRRGDRIGTLSNIALGVGAILMAAGGVLGLSSSYTLVGAVAGLILVILGAVLSFFTDDPVTSWLKNGYWGTSGSYLYWDDQSRSNFIAAGGTAHEGQRMAIVQGREGLDIPRYFSREMQQFHEFVYWPQNAPDPPSISAVEYNWLGVRKRMATPLKYFDISFRLPNYILGYSAFDGRIVASILASSDYSRTSNIFKMDVSDQFWESAAYGGDDTVTGRFKIEVSNNANHTVIDDIKWELLKVELAEGWVYTPLPGLILPRKYDDEFFGGGWTDQGAGKGGALVISGA